MKTTGEINMLPKHHYSDEDSTLYNDSLWLEAQLDQLPINLQKKVAERYSEVYFKLTADEERGVRFRCNSWLSKTVAKYRVINQDGSLF